MANKKVTPTENLSFNKVVQIANEFEHELDTNPQYSLTIDPLNRYHFTDQQKEFIRYMIDYKNVQFVSTMMMHIELQEGLDIYKSYEVQNEIKRINLSMYARRFCSNIADLDALGGYLTTAITDENVPIAERLSPKEKLTAVRLLMELNQLKEKVIENPEVVDVQTIEAELKELKVKDLEKLIENSGEDEKTIQKKNELIAQIDKDGLLTPEEVTYLKTESVQQLKKLLKDTQGAKQKNEAVENKN